MPARRMVSHPARIENLPHLLAFVEDSCRECGADADMTYAVKLAVEEVSVNLVHHGYAGMDPGPIEIAFEGDPSRVVVSIRDQGRPFSPDDAPVPDLTADWQHRPIGGLGWHLVRSMVDRIEYRSDPENGNCLTFTRLKRAATK